MNRDIAARERSPGGITVTQSDEELVAHPTWPVVVNIDRKANVVVLAQFGGAGELDMVAAEEGGSDFAGGERDAGSGVAVGQVVMSFLPRRLDGEVEGSRAD